ncbi:hypothetical protein LZC95_21335 [Pendulispora brunnea]|uniref:Uncharacterized protein n=1 Tax=Pendulispora brunnea TaxID=2905690 RepID=A0ABZ2KNW7_9BACT
MTRISQSYVRDTWSLLEYQVGWCFNSPETDEAWPGESLRRFYRALGEYGRVRAVRIESGEYYHGDVFNLCPENRTISFDEAMAHLRAFRGELGTVVLELELRVFVRLVENRPLEIAWVGERTEGIFYPTGPHSNAHFWFKLGHTLFRAHSRDGADNSELAHLNAPVLRQILERFKLEFGPADEYDGEDVTLDGFEPPTSSDPAMDDG